MRRRRFAAPDGEFGYHSLYGLYQLYEWFLVDPLDVFPYALKQFWSKRDWRVDAIPDPEDENPARYALLACVAYVLEEFFNWKISWGASRVAGPIMTMDEVEALMAVPLSERAWEKIPKWAEAVPALDSPLLVPVSYSGELGLEAHNPGPEVWNSFASKNIVVGIHRSLTLNGEAL